MPPEPVSRRGLLRHSAVAGTAAVGGAVVGYTLAQNDQRAHPYKAITGVWTTREASRPEDSHSLLKIEFSTESATAGEAVGTFQALVEKGGEVRCTGMLSAHHSDPPTYWVDVEGEGPGGGLPPCSTHVRYRIRHDPEGESHDPPGEIENVTEHLHLFTRRILRAGTDEDIRYAPGVVFTRESD